MENVSLQKVSGVCAILTALSAIAGFILFALTDVENTSDAAELLPAIDDDKAIVGAAIWLLTLAPVLFLGAMLGIYQALRGAGEIMRIALVAIALNALLIIISNLIALGVVYEVATPYVEAGADAGADLLVLGDALITMSLVAQLLGNAIGSGIGVLLFSIAILKTGFAAKWVGLLGLVAALGGWLGLFTSTSEVFEIIGLVGSIVFFVWLIALGVVMLRSSEDEPATASA